MLLLLPNQQGDNQARSHGGARGGGGSAPPLEKFEPPLSCAVPFAVTIGIEVIPPLEFCQPPLLTIPGYCAGDNPVYFWELHEQILACHRQ